MKCQRVSEAVCEEFRLVPVDKVKRVGSEEADPDKMSNEQYLLEQKILHKLESQQAKKEAMKEIQ